MSESSKMGLFGSKDDNTGAVPNADENEPTKPKENSSERYNTPYNIDSDSETYDTEALSIMDINDIIGVQAESAGDSTLESEFAALSEVITDCKDTCRDGQKDDKKQHDSAGMASMSKSLQLIGEAYISEDSQETDAEEMPDSKSPKAADLKECLGESKSNVEDAKIAEKGSSDKTVASSSEQTAVAKETVEAPCIADLKEDSVVKEITEEPQENTEEAPKSSRIDKSVDSTDSAVVDKSTDKPDEEDETENMDVDRSPPENIAEAAVAESQSKSKIEVEASKENEVVDESQVKSAVTEREEPMEVDQASDEIPARVDSANVERAASEREESSDSLATKESKIPSESDEVQSDEGNKGVEEISRNVEESVVSVGQKDESIEVPKVVDEEPESSVDISKNEESDAEKLEMEVVDEQNEESVGKNVESEKSGTEIVDAESEKSIGENVEAEKLKTEIVDARTDQSIGENVEPGKSEMEIVETENEKSVEKNVESEKSETEIVEAQNEKTVEKNVESEKSETEIVDPENEKSVEKNLESGMSETAIVDAQNEKSVEKNLESEKSETEIIDARNEKSVEKNLESEKSETEIIDARNEKSVEKNLESEKSESAIGAPIADSSAVEIVIDEASPEKDEEPEERPESPRKISSDVDGEASSLQEAESEPMEVDDNLPHEQAESRSDEPVAGASDLSTNCADIVESVSDISLKETTSASASAEPKKSEDAANIAESVQYESSPNTMSIDEAEADPVVTATAEKSSTSADFEEPESKPAVTATAEKSSASAETEKPESKLTVKLEENTNEESATSLSDLTEKSLTATLRVDSKPEVGSTVAANEESLAISAESCESPAEKAQEDSTPEIESMETGNEESLCTVAESCKKFPGENVLVDSTPEVGSNDSAIVTADESCEKSSPIVSSRVEAAGDAANEFTDRASTEFAAEDEKMEVDGGMIDKRKEEENERDQPETALEQPEKSPAIVVPEVGSAEQESTVSKTAESDVQETAAASSRAASPEVTQTDEIVEASVEVPVEASMTTICEKECTETRADDAVNELPEDEDDCKKDSNAEKVSPIITETAESAEKSGEIEAAERSDEAAKENEEPKPEAKEETPESSIAIEAEETLADVAADAKDEETEKRKEPLLGAETAVHESISIEETIQDKAATDVEEKSSEVPDSKVSAIEAEAELEFSKPKMSREAVITPNDAEEEPAEEMNLSLDPESAESREEAHPVGRSLTSEEMATDPNEEIEDRVETNLSPEPEEKTARSPNFDKTSVADCAEESSMNSTTEKPEDVRAEMNLFPEVEEKTNELPRILTEETSKTTVEDCTEESMTSTADKVEEIEERNEKSCEEIDEYSKDIEPATLSVPEMFHDEQSQTTQEMMESILETDTGNLNKILDAEEAEGEALARSNALPLGPDEIDELSDKSPSESDELLNKELEDPSQNIDSLEGLLDLDLIPETDESQLKVVEPIVEKVMSEAEEDIETIGKEVDVSLLLDETEQADDYSGVVPKVEEEIAAKEIADAVDIVAKSVLEGTSESLLIAPQLASAAADLIGNEIDAAFTLSSVVPDPLEVVPLVSEETKMDLAEDLLREIAVEEERKMKLAEQLFLESAVREETKIDLPDDLLLETAVEGSSKIDLADDVDADQDIVLADPVLLQSAVEAEKNIVLDDPILLQAVVPEDSKIELSEEMDLESAVQDQVLSEVATEIEDFAPTSEISELESAVKFLQESVEQDIDSPLVLSPKLVDSVVEDIAQEGDVGIFVAEADICDDPSELVAELESIIPDPIAISEAEIISEAAKLESERKTKEAKLHSPIVAARSPTEIEAKIEPPILKALEKRPVELCGKSSPLPVADEAPEKIPPRPETPKTHEEPREVAIDEIPVTEKMEQEPLLKKSAPIPKMSILEERLKVPPKIEIPVGEVSRLGEMPTTPKTSLLIQRDAKIASYQKMLESPKSSEKTELKIVETPRKDSEKHDFENVGSPRIILKIAKSAIADCGEPRSPKSPKIRSATNSPNPEDSPGQKLGKIKLKLSKGGHPSIIPNDNVEEICGQWHTEGTSSLSPLGMKIKFSKSGDASIVQTEKHEPAEEPKEPKHKFEEAKRTESPIGMKIKLSRTGDPSIVQQDSKESTSKHKDKMEMMQGSPKRTESPIGMKIKLSKSGDASIIQPEKQESIDEYREGSRSKDKLDVPQDVPRRTESPLGMKIKLFKTGDASIVQPETADDVPQDVKRTDSPLGMKIKLSKNRGGASIVPADGGEDVKEKLEVPDVPRRTESPLGMKFKLSKSGDASIIHSEESKESSKHKERPEASQDSMAEVSSGVKIKVTKCGEVAVLQTETVDSGESEVRTSSIGMKIKLSKSGDASIVHSDSQEQAEESRGKERADKIDSSIGMKIKLSRTGDASIIHNPKKSDESSSAETSETDNRRSVDAALKMKLQKSGEASIVEAEKKSSRRKESELPLEMKIKLSKTGHPTIVACENYGEPSQRPKESVQEASVHGHAHKHKEAPASKENPGMKMLKSMHSANLHGGRSELTIEPIQLQNRKSETTGEASPKRKDVTISPIESKKAKLEAKLSQMLPEVTIQPIMPRDPKKMMFDAKASSISRQQMNVISQEISITQVRPTNKPMDLSMTDKLKSMLAKNVNANVNSDCEIIERHPELIIVNENSNSSQEVMIIEEVPALRGPDAKIPKKRGRPRRNPMPLLLAKPMPQSLMPAEPVLMRDPLALDDVTPPVPELPPQNCPPKENERPKRTCSRQKSYAPPRRGRRRGGGVGGGRGKRKMEMSMDLVKKPRIEQDLDIIEHSTTALITIDETPSQPDMSHNTSELYKALSQPPMDSKMATAMARVEAEQAVNDANLMTKSHMESLMDSRLMSHLGGVMETTMNTSTPVQPFASDRKISLGSLCGSAGQVDMATDHMDKSEMLAGDDKLMDKVTDDAKDGKDASSATDHQNWLTPSSKRQLDGRNEGNISNVQVIDEETRMSAESVSRSQTPARNMSAQASETIVNEESQGSVLSTATTESEKVKVKNRRMEINFDPDEGPFTVDKIAEYEWPPDPARKSETFMIQEQISQYLGVKSFKRKYPELKRRMVDMEERNFLRENALVSESMCDMGLTAVSSSEVLDVMCNDFPDQYEEYRKYIREKQMKEHSKKQKELTAAANAERNRIDLAEMAVQSALSWNVGLNKARRESRKCSLDLQTFTIHVPKKQQKVEEESKVSHYPVALIPGQYTDYYREYTPAELRYYPLNTVLYGPMKPNERKFDSQSEGSQSDSDSDSSSDDSSSSSSDGTQDTEESQSTMDEVDVELSRQKEDIKSIKCKMCLKHLNKFSRIEVLIQCGTCNGYVHPSCIDLTLDMVPHIQAYAWQCTDCKTCAQCHDPADEDKMLFCDMCDRGYHIYCVGLRRVPQGRWHCQECAVCASCGSREAGGANSDRNSVAQWQHEYKKGDKNTRVYVSTLCVPCSKLWRKGRYCPHCSRCHTVPRLDLEANLVHCSACDKYLHLGCVETKDLTIDRKNYLCDFCQPNRQQMVKPLVSKVFRT